MFGSVEEAKKWQNIQTGTRIHPYANHKRINQAATEVISLESGEEGSLIRIVLIDDGSYEVWVKVAYLDEYGYSLRPEETVPEAVFDAIVFKCKLLEADRMKGAEPPVSFEEARTRVQAAAADWNEEAMLHLLIGLYYAAKMDPAVSDDTVADFREMIHEHTGHVDTSNPEVLRNGLDDVLE